MKCCQSCRQTKPASEYSRDVSRRDGLRTACKLCTKKHKAEYRKRNKQRISEADAAYREKNRSAVNSAVARWRKKNPEKARQSTKNWATANPWKVTAYSVARFKYVAVATPRWADRQAIDSAYELAAILSRSGVKFEVDHIVPLQSNIVCGLHCEENLRVITRRENRSKGNRFWPDMPGV